MKILAVYNTCGLSGRNNVSYYIEALNSILNQQFEGVKIVISDCCSHPYIRNELQNTFRSQINYNFIDDVVPVNVTFNHTVLKSIQEFGEFEGYLYVDSGVKFTNNNQLAQLYNILKSGPYGMVSARVDEDSGTFVNFGLGEYEGDQSQEHKLFKQGNLIIPVGKAVNLHCQIFSNDIQQYYGKCFTDIFASWCSESVFSFVCAAIQKKWIVVKDVIMHHQQGVDGQSSGFNPQVWKLHGNKNIDHPFCIPSIIQVMKEGRPYGLGYEECQNIIMHDKTQYDQEGYCVNEKLKQYIKEKLFLQPSQFDYQTILHTWI